MSGAVIAGSGLILGSGIFPGVPSWAIALSNVAIVVGLLVCLASIGFLIGTRIQAQAPR
jgi:hypothetical protein